MKVYYGWHIVTISIVTLTVAIGGSIQAFGLFVLPVSSELHLTRAQVNTGAILLNIGMAIAGPLIGRLMDRHSARIIAAASAVLFGGSLILLGLSSNIWLSSLIILLPLAAAAVGCGTVTSPGLVARWFTVHRGRAMAIAMLGISFGPIVIVPIVGLLIERLGWRNALIIEGVAGGGLLLLLALLVRDRPRADETEVGTAAMKVALPAGDLAATGSQSDLDAGPMPIGRILRLPQFWSIGFGMALAYGIMQAIIVSMVPFGMDKGLTLGQGASLLSMFGVSSILGSLLVAWLGDRFDRTWLLTALVGVFAVVGASPSLAGSYMALLGSTALIGLIGGAVTPVFLALLADLFGPASFGTVNGTASFISTMVSALFIRLSGEIFDRTGSYDLMFLTFLLIGVMATLLIFATAPLSRHVFAKSEVQSPG